MNMFYKVKPWGLALGLACMGAAQAAPDVSLEVTHQSSVLGADGIKRSSVFSERVVRQGDTVWIERVMPAGAHQEDDHAKAKVGAAKDHKHADLSAATRWIQRLPDGKLKFRLVAMHDKVVVNVPPAEYATVGFDGAWLAAYHLIDPAVLKTMKASESTSQGQWYESAKNGNKVRVLWDAKREMPLQVVSQGPNGSRSTMVKVLGSVVKNPWDTANKFVQKDYSDFLD
ncbi:hypothetical protein C5F52_27465 [Limnohabitans sp. TS-CS-82]|uniref:hypothetical protein n=1 Tax=Limnohabitans sp. TS-CS-82 TaxID=2094193 RepID=UPI000CF2DFCD|nr:hypothetical protein [Limnohabitans sp. TS-CS-82]PQA79943.1 hypothetical protein C5F52_27465 [Limnohabitans sp. TS-CS-82]